MERLAADSAVLEIFGELLVTLLVHNMGTVWWLDYFFTLEARGERFAADGARGARKVRMTVGGRGSHIDHVVVCVRRW